MGHTGHLASSRLFRGLDEGQLSELMRISDIEMFDREEAIFREGDWGDCLYVVLQGEVRIQLQTGGGQEALAILQAGQSFGEMAAIDEAAEVRSASAIAHSDCSLLSIAKEELQTLLSRQHGIACVVLGNVVRDLSAQLRATNNKLLFLSSAGRFE